MISTEYNEEWALAAQRREGREEGREEGKIEMVKNLFSLNVPIEIISKASKKTKEEILKIIEKN